MEMVGGWRKSLICPFRLGQDRLLGKDDRRHEGVGEWKALFPSDRDTGCRQPPGLGQANSESIVGLEPRWRRDWGRIEKGIILFFSQYGSIAKTCSFCQEAAIERELRRKNEMEERT